MVETRTGHNRSNGISYDEILATDRVPPPAVYLENSPLPTGVTRIPARRYFSQEEHDREVERLDDFLPMALMRYIKGRRF